MPRVVRVGRFYKAKPPKKVGRFYKAKRCV